MADVVSTSVNVLVLFAIGYLAINLIPDDTIYDMRKSIHCRLMCLLLDDLEDSDRYVHNVLTVLNSVGLLYVDTKKGTVANTSWFDNLPFVKAFNEIGLKAAQAALSAVGLDNLAREIGNFNKWNAADRQKLIDLFDPDQPFTEQRLTAKRAVYYNILRDGCIGTTAACFKNYTGVVDFMSPKYCKDVDPDHPYCKDPMLRPLKCVKEDPVHRGTCYKLSRPLKPGESMPPGIWLCRFTEEFCKNNPQHLCCGPIWE